MMKTLRFFDDTFVVSVKEQMTCDLAGEAAVLHLPEGLYYGLNTPGAFLWEQIQKGVTVRDLREAMLQEFDVSPEAADRDLISLLWDLKEARLIEVRHATANG